MRQNTIKKLNQVNQNFYIHNADSFSQTRQQAWQGWNDLQEYLPRNEMSKFLDIGCGNGRFLQFLNQKEIPYQSYSGIDTSKELLSYAEKTYSNNKVHFYQQDLLELNHQSFSKNFDVIVSFGVFHHIPGLETRQRLLNNLARILNPEGLLIVSFWKFAEFTRFQKRTVNWSQLPEIDTSDLEEGDYLLNWQNSQWYRYCHFASNQEIEQLIEATDLTTISDFRADGTNQKLNQYVVLKNMIST